MDSNEIRENRSGEGNRIVAARRPDSLGTIRKGIRWGLCCLFKEEPISFAVKQASRLLLFDRSRQLTELANTVLKNGHALLRAIAYCSQSEIGSFRINSRLFPLKTHPQVGYSLDELPNYVGIAAMYNQVKALALQHDIRLTFHPDQFTLLSSADEGVITRSIAELVYHAEAAMLVGADVITLHGGGGYGDKPAALERLVRNIDRLPDAVRARLALENDDRVYAPAELLPICRQTGIPFVYDVHHHRCLADGLTIEAVTEQALATWVKEPVFHLSSPKEGWQAVNPRPHHEYIDINDLPPCWRDLAITVEVEAKAKELALRQLHNDLARTGCA